MGRAGRSPLPDRTALVVGAFIAAGGTTRLPNPIAARIGSSVWGVDWALAMLLTDRGTGTADSSGGTDGSAARRLDRTMKPSTESMANPKMPSPLSGGPALPAPPVPEVPLVAPPPGSSVGDDEPEGAELLPEPPPAPGDALAAREAEGISRGFTGRGVGRGDGGSRLGLLVGLGVGGGVRVGATVGLGFGGCGGETSSVGPTKVTVGPFAAWASKRTVHLPAGTFDVPRKVPFTVVPATSRRVTVFPATKATTFVAAKSLSDRYCTDSVKLVAVVPLEGDSPPFRSSIGLAACTVTGIAAKATTPHRTAAIRREFIRQLHVVARTR